jgi:GNAT superfamily N-acetyltransferase
VVESAAPFSCVLVSPDGVEPWRAYHDIRRRILFESRGRHGVYDSNHPEDRQPNHYPKLLLHAGRYVGVVRIDIKGDVAHLRRVAIDEPYQRQGFGRILLGLAEAFAREHGATRVESAVAVDATAFYAECGYRSVATTDADSSSVPMHKELSTA